MEPGTIGNRIECEIKLRYAGLADARAAVAGVGAAPLRQRRLQDDRLLDFADGSLRRARSVLRVRTENGSTVLTFKGTPQRSTMKVREELETGVGDGKMLCGILSRLGLHVWFRYQKFREEYSLGGVVVAIDETPVGVFIELEGDQRLVSDVAQTLGRSQRDYIVDSYRGIYLEYCRAHGLTGTQMVFEDQR